MHPHPPLLTTQVLILLTTTSLLLTITPLPPAHASGGITVTNPVGGTYYTTDTITITWTATHGFTHTTIELYTTTNDLITTIATDITNTGSYTWTITQDIQTATNYQIRISDTDNQTTDGYSTPFTIIKRTITITSPTNGATIYTDDTITITWTTENLQDTLAIRLRNTQATYSLLDYIPTTQHQTPLHIPPNLQTGTYQLTLTPTHYPQLATSTTITIHQRRLTITTPTTPLYIGDTYPITWTSDHAGDTITLTLQQHHPTQNYYETILTITPTTPNDGTYTWLIPTLNPNTTYTITIQSTTYTQTTNTTQPFTLQERYLTITTPTPQTTWYISNTYTITWTSKNAGPHVTLTLYQHGTPTTTIATNTTNNGTYTWTIPTSLTPDITCTIQIKSTTIDTLHDTSDPFILQKKTIHITSPPPHATWQQGDHQTITWDTQGFTSNLRIELCQGVTAAYTLATNTTNTGSYTWTIPTDLTPDIPYQIKITSTSDDTIYAYSPELYLQPTFLQQWWMLITLIAIAIVVFLAFFIYLIRKWKAQAPEKEEQTETIEPRVPSISQEEYDNIWEPQRPK
jgi:hypothetical protein